MFVLIAEELLDIALIDRTTRNDIFPFFLLFHLMCSGN